jgi:methionyl-tRNA formyltransferase
VRILFFGTPAFAVPSLESLLAGSDEVVGVVSQPDKPRGRGLKPEPTPVACCARAAGVPLHQPDRLNDEPFLLRILELEPDLGVTCAFGRILRPALLKIPRLGFLNVHASLLPRHRGASPISRAILEGDSWTGVTIFRLDEGMDTGPVLLQRIERIRPDDTTGALSDRLARLGASALCDACEGIRSGRANYTPQPIEGVTHAPLLRKEDGVISWARPADQIERFVRAMNPWPGASTRFRGQPLKLLDVDLVDLLPPGETPGVLLASDPFPVVAALPGRIRLRRIQPAGRKEMDADSWGRGARLEAGESLE